MKRIPDDWTRIGMTGPIPEPCLDAEHNPPMHAVLEPGTYCHTCPTCSNEQIVVIQPRPF